MRKQISILLCSIFIFATSTAFASHIVGGVINYRWISGTTYEITMKIYRDCGAGSSDFDGAPGGSVPFAPLGLFNETTNSLVTTYNLSSPVVTSIVPVITNPCMVTTSICLEEGVYRTTITLPSATTPYYLTYVRCCRNGSISNIPSPGSTGASFTVRIPPTSTYHNSNPVYNAFPPIYICQNAPLVFNHSANDIDGDSLFYQLCSPNRGASTGAPTPSPPPAGPYTPLTFSAPYSATDPMGSTPPPAVALTIDPSSGVLTCVPPTLGQFVVGVCVSEYRGGVLLSTTMRDCQFNVISCPIPVANIPSTNIDPSTGIGTYQINCDSFTVGFRQTSSGATRFHWDFGVPTITTDTSNLTTPRYTYSDTGTYRVTLVAYDAAGCIDTTYAYTRVYPGFTPSFFFDNECVDTAVQFYDSSRTQYGSINYWKWTFGDAPIVPSYIQNPSHLYAAAGTYAVSLQIKSTLGCDKTVTKNVVIDPKPVANFTNDSTCINSGVYFRNTSTISSGTIRQYTWNFGDLSPTSSLTNPTHTYTSVGTYSVTLSIVSDSGCAQSITRNITIHPRPIITKSPDTTICTGSRTQLVVSGGSRYFWTPATGLTSTISRNPFATPTANTTYRVIVADTNKCNNTDSIKVSLYTNVPNFTFTNECRDTAVQFTDLSSSTGGTINTWNWNFGDLTSGIIQNPLHLYATQGLYNVKLVFTTDKGCKDSTTKQVRIYPIPNIGFIYDSSCVGFGMYFKDTTRYFLQNDSISYRNWTFSNGVSINNNASTSTIFTTTGLQSATLTVISDSGCQQQITRNFFVHPRPTIITSPDTSICPGSTTQLFASGGNRYFWSPTTSLSSSTIANPFASPSVNTTYQIFVADSNRCNNLDSIQVKIYVNHPDFTFTNECRDTAVQFTDLSTSTGGSINNWNWNFGDLTFGNTQNPLHLYATQGLYTVKLIFTTDRGCKDSTTQQVRIYPIPNPGFIYDSSCIGYGMYFNDTTRYFLQNDSISSRNWSFSNGVNVNNVQSTSTIFNTSGLHSATLTVISDSGCLQRITRNFIVHALPFIQLPNDTTICPFLPLQLQAGGALNYYWTSDSTLSDTSISNPIVRPVRTSTTYYLQVNDTNRCQNNDSITIRLHQLYPVDAGKDSSVCLAPGSFFDSTQLIATGGISFSWTPNYNISNTNIYNPFVSPDINTVYYVAITDSNHCTQIDSVKIIVLDPNLNILTATDTFLCLNDTIQIRVADQGVAGYTWTPNLWLSDHTVQSPRFFTRDTTTYIVQVVNYCYTKRDTITIYTYPLPTVKFTYDTTCINSAVNFTDNSVGNISSWYWSFGDSTFSSLQNPIHTYTNDTIYKVVLIDTTNLGCIDSSIKYITVFPNPVISGTADTNLCPNEFTSLLVTGGNYYYWTPASALTNDTINNPTTTILTDQTYVVTVQDDNSCNSFDTIKVHYYYLTPDFYLSNECIDTAVQFADSSKTDAGIINVWNWNMGNGHNETTKNPFYQYPSAGNYNVTLYIKTTEGCDTSITKSISIFPLPFLNIPRLDSICIGETYQINADSSLIYAWDPQITINPLNVHNPILNPLVNTQYNVTLQDSNHCVNRDSFILLVRLLPNANITNPPAILCRGNSFTLNATGGGTYLWQPGELLSDSTLSNPSLVLADSSKFVLKVTNQLGCSNYDTIYLNVQQPVIAFAEPDTAICQGTQIQLLASGGLYYSWTPNLYIAGSNLQQNPFVTPDSSMNYIVQVSNDCFNDTALVAITVYPLPLVNAGADQTIYRNTSTTLNALGTGDFVWYPTTALTSPFTSTTSVSPIETTQYIVMLTDINGCINYDTVKVEVIANTLLLLPTAFSPNGDGVNDVFRIAKWLNIKKLITFNVYNRWGELVFTTDDINAGWDGNYKNYPQPTSSFTWAVKAEDYDGNEIVKKGIVTLIR